MTDLYDAVLLRDERLQQYTYSPVRRAVQRVKALLAAVPPGALGFDVSVWQAFVDFNLAKAAGLTWAYIRALYGLVVDGKFPVHFPAAKGIIPRTAYLYYRDYENPKTQAQKLYDTCQAFGDGGEDTPGDFMPVFDLETIGNPTLTASKVKACLEELARLFGKTPLIYSGYYVIRDALTGEKGFLSAYSLIIAAYPFTGWTDDLPQKVLQYPPLIPAPFVMWTSDPDEPLAGRVVGWQFTASAPASLFGVSGNFLDLDWCSPAFAKQVLNAAPPVDPPPSGEDEMRNAHVIAPFTFNARAKPTANSIDVGDFQPGETVTHYPADDRVLVPNVEEWWHLRRADGTVCWGAKWHPSIKVDGKQVPALADV